MCCYDALGVRNEEVFNIEVDGDHVYRVGQQGLLVHNMSQGQTGGTAAATGQTPCPQTQIMCKVDDSVGANGQYPGPYADLEAMYNDVVIVAHARFDPKQKARILQANRDRNGTKLLSDLPAKDRVTGELVVVTFTGRLRNVPKPRDAQGFLNEAQIDHIKPYAAGGSNSYCNARVVSQQLNEDLKNGGIQL